MLIDFHTHSFPSFLAHRALSSLKSAINIEPLTDGTAESLIKRLDEWGVAKAVVCNIATSPKQNTNVNNYALELMQSHGDRLIPLASVHPHSENISDEICRVHSLGLKGIKIHPESMGVMIDDRAFDEIFDLSAELGMFIVTHAGYDCYSPNKIWAPPQAVLNRMSRSPKSTLICAHMGGNRLWSEVSDTLLGKNLYIDTAVVSFDKITRETAEKMLLRHDPERILFGSDCPWASSAETFEFIDSLRIPSSLKEKIFSKNALSLIEA